MRISGFVSTLLLGVALAAPALLRAQFQAPTDEELKMTADPKAPGAAAVYLNVEEVTDDPQHFCTVYTRIKVLKEKGKELATVEISFPHDNAGITSVKPQTINSDFDVAPAQVKHEGPLAARLSAQTNTFKISNIKARTIHADGTVISFTVRPEDIPVSRAPGKQYSRAVFTLPSVEVGSILEYRYTVQFSDQHFSAPFWQIQRPYFVHKAHFAFNPFNDFLNDPQAMTSRYLLDARGDVINTIIGWPNLPPGVKIATDAIGHLSLDLTDIPPVPNEEWMPPQQSLSYHVLFYYINASNEKEFWTNDEKNWSKDVDRFAEPTAALRQIVGGLVVSGDNDLERAKKLYLALQALDNTDFSPMRGSPELNRPGSRTARRAEDIWSQKSGSSEDIALLYLAMLRAAGLTAYGMKLVDRDRGVFTPGYLSFDQFDGDMVILNSGGKEIVLDPGQKMCPFQTMHWKHAGATGVRQSASGPSMVSSPLLPYTANSLFRTGDVTLDDRNGFTGDFRFLMTGQEALYWRQESLMSGESEVKKRFDDWLASMVPQGVEAHVDHFLALDNPELNLVAVINLRGTLGSSASQTLQLPAFFFEARNHPFVDQALRQNPVDMHYGEQIIDQAVFHLPAEMSVQAAPPDVKIPWAGHAAFASGTKSAPGQITVVRQLARAFTFAKPEEYQDLRGFDQKVAAADQAQLVLTTAAPAVKGN